MNLKPGELTNRQAVAVTLVGVALLSFSVVAAGLIIGELPEAERAPAWRWFALVAAVTAFAASIYQVLWWRSGALDPDDQEKLEEYRLRMKAVRGLILPAAGLNSVLALFVSQHFYVVIIGMGMGCMACILVLGLFAQFTKRGRALRQGRL